MSAGQNKVNGRERKREREREKEGERKEKGSESNLKKPQESFSKGMCELLIIDH